MISSIQELHALRGGTSFKPYAVGECWGQRTHNWWLARRSQRVVAQSGGAFDFPLRWRLRDLCDSYGFSLRTLAERGVWCAVGPRPP
jgi:alpha-amylase